MESFLLLGCLQLSILALFLQLLPIKEKTDRYLIWFLVAGCLSLLSKIIIINKFPQGNINYTISSTLALVAFSHLFLQEVICKKRQSNRLIILHQIPFYFSIVYFFTEWIFFSFSDNNIPLIIDKFIRPFESNVRKILLAAYIIIDIALLRKYHFKLRDFKKSANHKLVLIFLVHKIFLFCLIEISYWKIIPENGFMLVFGVFTIPILGFFVAYFKIISFLKEKINSLESTIIGFSQEKPKYAKSEIEPQKAIQLKSQILKHLEDEKSHLNPDYSLENLAQSIKIPKHEISLVLNQHLNTNFYQLINEKRIHYFLEHLDSLSRNHQTILSLAYESGFNSKSTFNKYFKSVTGKSPSKYLKNDFQLSEN